jgi:cytidylate kinase
LPVITISRQYASGGGEVAQIVAEKLNAVLLDRELIYEVSQRLGLPEDLVSEHEERGETIIARLVSALRVSYPDSLSLPDITEAPGEFPDLSDRALVQVTEQVMQQAASNEDVVIVGRGSQFVLRNHPRALHVHVYAPFDSRVQAVMKEQIVGRQEAERIVKDFDGARASYARHFYHADWQAPQYYHLLVNCGALDRQVAADLIYQAARSIG